jgi:hypothetical protein
VYLAQRALNIFGRMLSMRKHVLFFFSYPDFYILPFHSFKKYGLRTIDYKSIAGQADLSMIGASRMMNDVDIGKNDGPQLEIAETFREWDGTLFR